MNSNYKTKFNDSAYGNWDISIDRQRIDTITGLTGNSQTVLDVGCGIGDIGTSLMLHDNDVYGIDISQSAIKKAIKRGLKAHICDIENEQIPFNLKFDVIIAAEIIEHIFNTDDFLEKISKKLRKGGKLIITTPNIASFGRRLLLLFGKNPIIETHSRPGTAGHIRYFTKDTLLELVESHGFKIVHFQSSVVNLNSTGSISSVLLATLFPTFGKTLIIKAIKT